jgi:hypothetical protein
LISWLALIISTSLLARNSSLRDQRRTRYEMVRPPTEADLQRLREQLTGRTGEFSYGVRPGDYFPSAPERLDAAVRAEAKAVLSAHGVPEAELESAVNSIEKIVTTVAALQLAGRSVEERAPSGFSVPVTFSPALRGNLTLSPAAVAAVSPPPAPKAAPEAAPADPLARVQSFLVHGHEMESVIAVKNYLQNELGMPQPIVLIEKPDESLPIQLKFEKYAMQADVAIVFLTPDDVGGKAGSVLQPRARQNAIGELFWFKGRFGPSTGRVLILHRGEVELPSDFANIGRWDLNKGLDSVFLYLNRELRGMVKRDEFRTKPGTGGRLT